MKNDLSRKLRTRRAPERTLQPRVDSLEERMLLFAFNGGEWVHASRITYSFAPDGTDIGGIPSNLNAAMAQRGFSTDAWQHQFRRAAAAWQAVANLNFSEVPDDGSPFATSGNQQGDPRFGDIRIAGIAQESGILGLAFLPPPINGGTLAGDILLNSAAIWKINSDYDIMTVALHEFGHSLGLDHSTITAAAMFPTYTGVKQTLHSDDTAGISSSTLYGPRQIDAFDGGANNNVFTRATSITPYIDSNLHIRLSTLDITTSGDIDWYHVVAPTGTNGTLTVTMQSSQLSLLSPRVTVYNAAMRGLGQSDSNAFGATVSFTVNGVQPGQGFYIRAMPSGLGANTGNYGLLLNFGSTPIEPIAPPDTVVPEAEDMGGGYSNLALGGHEHGIVQIGTLSGVGGYLFTEDHDHDHDHDHHDAHPAPSTLPSPKVASFVTFVTIDAGLTPGLETSGARPAKLSPRAARVLDALLETWKEFRG